VFLLFGNICHFNFYEGHSQTRPHYAWKKAIFLRLARSKIVLKIFSNLKIHLDNLKEITWNLQ